MREIEQLIQTLEILREAVEDRHQEGASATLTMLLLQSMSLLSREPTFARSYLPVLEELKGHIQAANFDEAQVYVLELLETFRELSDATESLED